MLTNVKYIYYFLKKHFPAFKVVSSKTQQDTLACCELLYTPWKWKILGLILYFIIYLKCSTDRYYLTFLYVTFMYKKREEYSESVNVISSRAFRAAI